jgi:Family of unknown function (DUF6151)
VNHNLQCRCGKVRGSISDCEFASRGICYCTDCQAFAHYLNQSGSVLDSQGGTDIIQASPTSVVLSQGSDQLACIRLTEKGLLRWYARCCNTPIGNTMASFRLSFVGLVHGCLGAGEQSLDHSFGPIQMRAYTKSAIGVDKPRANGVLLAVFRFSGRMLRARLNGSYRQTPFFDSLGVPVATPRVLSGEEHATLMQRVLG